MLIGVISDTHGVIREEALNILKTCDFIIHAGDIGNEDVLQTLEKLAPVYKIKGNVDTGEWAKDLPEDITIQLDNKRIYVIHNIKEIKFNPNDENYDVVIYGHSHKYEECIKESVLYLNPGGAGRKRFNLPLSLALLNINENGFTVERIDL